MPQRRVRIRAALLAVASLVSAIAIASPLAGTNPAGAADGDLDPTFGTAGVALIDFPSRNPGPPQIGPAYLSLDPSGRPTLLAQISYGVNHMRMQRLTTAGGIDATFDGAPLAGIAGFDTSRGMSVLPNGTVSVWFVSLRMARSINRGTADTQSCSTAPTRPTWRSRLTRLDV